MENTFFIDKLKSIPSNLKTAFISSVILGMLVHGFGFMNKFINEDTLFHNFHESMGYLYQAGRWLIVGLQFVRGFYATPWIIGIFAVLYMALSITFIISVLEIKNRIHCVVIALLIVAFPAWSNQFMYDFMADAYPAAMLFAVIAIFITKKYKFGFIAGGIAIMLSLALYQSFLGFAVGLSLMLLMRRLVANYSGMKDFALYAVRFVLCGVLGVAFYLISIRVSLAVTGGQLWTYQGMESLGQFSFIRLPELIINAYDYFLSGFTRHNPPEWLYVSNGLFVLYIIVFLLIALSLATTIVSRKTYKQIPVLAALGICFILLPLGLNITAITSPDAWMHTLMTNPFIFGVILLFLVIDLNNKKEPVINKGKVVGVLQLVALITTILIGGNYMRQTSTFYLVQHVQYERTFAFYNRLLTRIEETPGYEPGMPVALVGTHPFPYIGSSYALNSEIWRTVGFNAQRPVVGLGEPHKVARFMQNFFGVRIELANNEQIDEIMATHQFQDMPLYPRYGSVAVINDVLVVRLN